MSKNWKAATEVHTVFCFAMHDHHQLWYLKFTEATNDKPQNTDCGSSLPETYIQGRAVEVTECFVYLGSDRRFRSLHTGNTQMYWFSCEHNGLMDRFTDVWSTTETEPDYEAATEHCPRGTWKYEHVLSRLMHDDLHSLIIPQ